MTGKENIEIGDQLMCISNTGISSLGDKILVWGITEKSINTSGSDTGWSDREDFRWSNFVLQKSKEIPKKVIEFQNTFYDVLQSNKIVLERQKGFLKNRTQKS